MNIVELLETHPEARSIYKQMDKNNDTRCRLERLRMKALKKSDWDTAAELQTELAWCRSEGSSLTDKMIAYIKHLQTTGVKFV